MWKIFKIRLYVRFAKTHFCISNKFITFAVCLSSEFILWIYNI